MNFKPTIDKIKSKLKKQKPTEDFESLSWTLACVCFDSLVSGQLTVQDAKTIPGFEVARDVMLAPMFHSCKFRSTVEEVV